MCPESNCSLPLTIILIQPNLALSQTVPRGFEYSFVHRESGKQKGSQGPPLRTSSYDLWLETSVLAWPSANPWPGSWFSFAFISLLHSWFQPHWFHQWTQARYGLCPSSLLSLDVSPLLLPALIFSFLLVMIYLVISGGMLLDTVTITWTLAARNSNFRIFLWLQILLTISFHILEQNLPNTDKSDTPRDRWL